MVAYQSHSNGPSAKELTIGRVIVNERDQGSVVLQPYAGVWSGSRVVHRPYYQTSAGYSLVPGPRGAQEKIRYEALVLQVELLTGGELAHGSARRLSNGGWGLFIQMSPCVFCIR